MFSCLQIKEEELDVEDVEIIYMESVVKSESEQEEKMKDDRSFKCNLCPKTYRRALDLKNHMQCHEESKFKCNQCEKSYTYAQDCKKHMQSHEGIKCEFCPEQYFPSQDSYAEHVRSSHTHQPRFKCSLCKRFYSSEKSLKKHEVVHKDNPPMTCEFCDKQFWNLGRYNQHKAEIHDRRYLCEICNKRFPRISSLKRHKEAIHMKPVVHECKECGFSTKKNNVFKLHNLKHSEGIELKKVCCDRCDFMTFNLDNLKRHNRTVHEKTMPWYQCALCDFKSSRDKWLRTHVVKMHGGIEDFKCGECEQTFLTKLLLDVHMKEHAEIKHQCSRCLKCYKLGVSLEKHLRRCKNEEARNDEIPVDPDPLATDNGLEFFEEIPEVDNLLVVKDERDACQQSARMFSSSQVKKEELEVDDVKIIHLESVIESEAEQLAKKSKDDRPYKCNLCPKTYKQSINLRSHMYSHENEKKFKCNVCAKSYIYSHDYKRHMQTHEGFNCDLCHEIFNQREELREHKETHEKLRCGQCKTSFSSRSALRRHMHKIHMRFKCQLCLQSYSSEISLRKHEESHKDNPPVTCELCGEQFWSAVRCKNHKETHHEKRFSCETCSKQFPRKASLKRHIEVMHMGVVVFKCEECDFSTKNSKKFDVHTWKHSQGIVLVKMFCDLCDYVTFCKKNLTVHKRRLHDKSLPWYQCSLCDSKFRKDSVLRRHVFKLHGGIKDFKCVECGLTFMTKLLLDVHVKKHTVTKHRCGRCFKYYKNGDSLKKHEQSCTVEKAESVVDSQVKKEELEVDDVKIIHLESVIESEAEQLAKKSKDDRPYKCNQCPKTYKQSTNLRSHMYSHENEKKFKCNVCAKSYIYSQNYKRHMRTHEGFKCDFCPEIFNQREELREHKATHEKIRCGLCETSFSSRSALSRHMHKIHMRFKCQLCLQSYSSEISLRKHEESHKDNPPVTCELCGEQFWSAVRCKNHKETYHEKRFSCETCSKLFPRKASLKRHIEVMHMGVVVFKCDECDFSTKNSKEFDVHKWKHSQGIVLVKMFCDLCDFVTFRKKNLTIHKRRLHDKSLLWHQCSLCDSKFRKDGVLRRHVFKLHGGIKDFKCAVCGLTFMTKLLLDVHMKKHTVTKHRCARCYKYYKRGDTLKKHEQSCTGEKVETVDVPVDPDPLAIDNEEELFEEIEEVDNLLVVKDERDTMDDIQEEF